MSPRLGLNVAVDPDVMAAFDSAIARLRAAGWRIEEADVTWPEGTSETAFSAVNQAASALLYGERHAKDKDLFGDNVAGLIERGRSVPGTDVVAAFRFADACARAVGAVLHRVRLSPHADHGLRLVAGRAGLSPR